MKIKICHLVELAEPEEYDGKYEKWRKEDLPIMPGKDGMDWRYQAADGQETIQSEKVQTARSGQIY